MDRISLLAITLFSLFVSASYASDTEEMDVFGQREENPSVELSRELIGHHGTFQTVNDALLLSPSVDMYQNGRRSALKIRGLGYTGGPPNPGIEPLTSVYLDGVYIPRTHLVSSEIVALDSVEVYKHAVSAPNASPVGNLFLNSEPVLLGQDQFFLETGFGENNHQHFGVGAKTSLSRKSEINTYLYTNDTDGVYTNQFNDEKVNYKSSKGGYVKYLVEVTDDLNIGVMATQTEDDSDWVGSGRANSYLFTDAQRSFFNRNVRFSYLLAGATPPSVGDIFLPSKFSSNTVSSDLDNETKKLDRIASVSVDYSHNYYTISSTTSAIKSGLDIFADVDNTNFNLANQAINEDFELYSQDVKIVYYNDQYTLTNGFYVSETNSSYETTNYAGDDLLYLRAFIAPTDQLRDYYFSMMDNARGYGRAAPVKSVSNEDRTQQAYYFEFDSPESDYGSFKLGGSVSEVDKEFYKYQQGLCSEETSQLPNSECTPISTFFVDKYFFRGNSESNETGYVAFVNDDIKINESSTMSINLSRSKRIGGYGQTQSIGREEGYASSIDDLYFSPEYTNGFGLSWTSNYSKIKSSISVSPFLVSVEDYQLSYYDGLGFYTTNAEEVRSTGIEFLFDTRYFKDVIWITSASYTDAKYVENTEGPCAPSEYRTLENCNYLTWEEADAANDILRSDLSGESLRAPKVNASSMLKYILADLTKISSDFSIEAEYTGPTRTTEFIDSRFERGGFTTYNIYMNLSHRRAGVDLEFSVKNAADKEVKVLEFASPIIPKIAGTPGGMDAFMYPRRQLELLLRYNF